jgi:hypothetical protein
VQPLQTVIDKIDAVGADHVRRLAASLCEQARPALALYGPVEGAPTAAALAERLAA